MDEPIERRRSRHDLEASERRHRAILDSSVDFAIVATDGTGRITDWNTGAERLFGWSARDMVGQTLEHVFVPEDRAAGRLGVEMRLALSRGRASDERWHLRADGSRFFASGELMPLREADGLHTGYIKILCDRTGEHEAHKALCGAQEKLRVSEDHLRQAVELSPQVAWTCDPQGNIDSYSPRWLHLTGQAAGEPLGAGWAKALHPDDLPQTLQRFGACLASGEPVDVDYRVRVAATGQYRWMRARAKPRRDESGAIVRWYGVVEDVHDRKLAEAHLRESEARFRAFAQAVPNHIWSATPDGRLDWVNNRALAYGGTQAGDNTGNAWLGRLHPDDAAATEARWTEALASGAVYQSEFRLRRADGVYRWHLARAVPIRDRDGAIDHWIGTNTDIDDQKRAADVLAREAAMLGAKISERDRERARTWSLSPVLKIVGTADGDILAVNPAWTATLGWSEADTLGRNIMDFVAPEDRAAGAAGLAQLAAGTPVREFQNVFVTRSGGRRTIAWTTVPEDGRLYGFGRDITEQRVAEEALRQSQKMEAVGQLTGGLAHDFNNLLTGIIGSLELLSNRVEQGRFGEIDRYVLAARAAAERAAALTHRLLAFSRRQTLDPKPTDVNRLVAGMEELVRRTVGPAVRIETAAAEHLWPTLVDSSQLENALLNLCINARDAMPAGGRITVETTNHSLDPITAVTHGLPAGQYVSLRVSDTGAGMTPDVMARAFEPFFTTKPLGTGTGLGLSMIYGFARQSGGHVRIESKPGHGTHVHLYLPRYTGALDAAGPATRTASAPRAKDGETVLVVDDEPSVRMLVTETLADLGYAALEAADGASGLGVLQSDARIDLLVTDVGLPGGMNGRQMADAARARRPDLKILFITGYAETTVMGSERLEAGMQVLTKPFTMEALAARISTLITP